MEKRFVLRIINEEQRAPNGENHSDNHVFTDPRHDPSRPPAKATPVALLPSCQGRPLPSPPSLREAEGRNALSLNVTCNIVTTVATHLSW